MAPQTRSRGKASENKPDTKAIKSTKVVEKAGSKRKRNGETDMDSASKARGKAKEHLAKKRETANKKPSSGKLDKILAKYGSTPLSDIGIEEPTRPTPETVLAHLLNAMLTSARISHELATKSVKMLINAKFHHLEILQMSSWQERTEVLTEGGYTHYREKTATALGELAELIEQRYAGDLNNLRQKAGDDSKVIRKLIKEVKGFGDVGADIFCDSAQAIWPSLAPFIDPRSLKTAEELGLGTDVEKLYDAVRREPLKMAQLCTALTEIRLGKHEAEFK